MTNWGDSMEDQRAWAVRELLFDYLKSPSLRHIRDPHSVIKLANEIVRRLDRANNIWRKWDGQREVLLKSAVGCWVPIGDLRDFLNQMPGPSLTNTDVDQRLKAFIEEDHFSYPNEELQAGCLTLYEQAKAEGTELPAIIGLLREHVEQEEERIRLERERHYQDLRDQERIAREERLLSGADCKWTQLQKSPHWYCRTNGRTYRLVPTNDKKWELQRVNAVYGQEEGHFIGKYQSRGAATKVVAQVAYQPEPRW